MNARTYSVSLLLKVKSFTTYNYSTVRHNPLTTDHSLLLENAGHLAAIYSIYCESLKATLLGIEVTRTRTLLAAVAGTFSTTSVSDA
jgi:hypothetical protein